MNYWHYKNYQRYKEKRLAIVREKPRLTDWGSPYHTFGRRNPFLIPCFIFGLLIRLWILHKWDCYDDTIKEELKTDYFYYFWVRKYKKNKPVDKYKKM